MADYIEIGQLWKCETCYHNGQYGCTLGLGCDHGESYRPAYSKLKKADVAPVPLEYVYFTTADDENYLVDLTIVVSKKQFDAINSGEDLWTVLRNGGDGNG